MNIISFFTFQTKKAPWRTIALGIFLIIITVVCVVFVGNILDKIPIVAAFDKVVYEKINLAPHPAWLNTLVAPFNFNFLPWGGTFIPSFLYFVFGAGLLYIVIFDRKDIGFALTAVVLAIAIDTILFKITNIYVVRDRPFVHLINSMTESSKAIWLHWPTYPSGHVRDMALYSSVLAGYAKRLKWPFIILTLWVAYTRIYLGAHYPTDVLAGLLLGYFVGLGILMIIKSVQEIMKDKKTPSLQNEKI